jgi:tetratricopeptide (TPR) repeat protein
MAAARRALVLARTGEDVVQQALANLGLGRAYFGQDDYRQAVDYLTQAVAFFDGARGRERFGFPNLPAVNARCLLAWCHAELGTFAAGKTLGEEGLRIAEAVAHPGSIMVACQGLGLVALRQGDLPRALPVLERAMDIAHEADLSAYFPQIAPVLGAAYTLAGRVAEAVPLLTQALEQVTAKEIVAYQVRCHLSLGKAQLLAGHLEEAHTLAERARALARAHRERGNEGYALHLLGAIAVRRDPLEREQAEAHYRQALTLTNELGMRPLQAHCHRGLGMLYTTTGQREQARAELSAAVDLYQAMAMTLWLPETEGALAQVQER